MRTVAVFLLLLAGALRAEPDRGPFHKIAVIRLRESATEAIDDSVRVSVLRRIEMARDWGADCVVFDIESYGGYVHASVETADEIFATGREVHTIAYVGRKAISGAAMLALACQEIVLSETATIGDAQVIYSAAGGIEVAPEKFQTTVAATFRKYAEGNGYPVPLAEAMVRQEMEVTRYKKPNDPQDPSKDFTWVYYRTDTVSDGPSQRDFETLRLHDEEVVVRAGELPTLTAAQAVEYGLAGRLEPNLDALLTSISNADTARVELEWSWAERTSRFLLSIRAWLFLVGAGALYFALKMPGTGVPEALALLCFGLFFGASAVAHFAGALEVVLFLLGLLLLVVEIFVLPGFGVPGFAGLACVFASIALASIPEGGLPQGGAGGYLLPVAQDFLIGTLGGLAVVFFLVRNVSRIPYLNRLALGAPGSQTGSATMLAGDPERHPLVDKTGVAESTLRPAGRARIEGTQRDVVAEGGYVEPGTPVRVVSVRGNVITVRAERR